MRYVYEFIGAFFLVLTVGMTVMEPLDSGIMAPLAIGSILMVMVFAGGHVSGAHYNPAVSLAVFLRGRLSSKDLIVYWIAQLAAGCAAGFLTVYLKGNPLTSELEVETFKALIAEFLFTFALCFVVLNVATAKGSKNNSFYGLAIGFTVLAGAYSVGAISGGAFNPAVALGITIMNLSPWMNLWIFVVANFLGGSAAAWAFKTAHPGE